MKFTETVFREKKILLVTLQGDIEPGTMDEFVINVRTKAYELGYSLICDFTKSNNKISINEGLKISRRLDKPEFKKLKKVRVGFVATGLFYVFAKVVEQFMFNMDGDLRIFKDLDKAILWFSP